MSSTVGARVVAAVLLPLLELLPLAAAAALEAGAGDPLGGKEEVDRAALATLIGVPRRGFIVSVVRCAEESEIIDRRASWTPGVPPVRALRAASRSWERAASKRWKHSSRSCKR